MAKLNIINMEKLCVIEEKKFGKIGFRKKLSKPNRKAF